MRKPGEPIYLRKHLLALLLTVVATVTVPSVYELAVAPLSMEARYLFALAIGVVGGVVLLGLFRESAKNEPERRE
ncbi:MAG: hypothetical protein U0172_13550 [Nitrospiraceae bacterium]